MNIVNLAKMAYARFITSNVLNVHVLVVSGNPSEVFIVYSKDDKPHLTIFYNTKFIDVDNWSVQGNEYVWFRGCNFDDCTYPKSDRFLITKF